MKKSIETSDGILGFKPGTQLKKEADGTFTVEGRKLDVRANEVTNDLDLAARYAGADAQRQAVLRQSASALPPPPPVTSQGSPASQASQSSRPPAASSSSSGVVAPTRRVGSGLESSSSLGAGHSMTKDGWLWQKDASGNWRRVKPLR